MREGFVSLATLVRAARAPGPESCAQVASVPPSVPNESRTGVESDAARELLRELALVRAAATEAFERHIPRALAALASDVLARELALAPADVGALAERALAAYAEHEPVALAVCRADAERLTVALPVHVDDELAAGDLVLHVRDGAFESHVRLRLEHAIDVATDDDALR